jgi:hypothetical protein
MTSDRRMFSSFSPESDPSVSDSPLPYLLQTPNMDGSYHSDKHFIEEHEGSDKHFSAEHEGSQTQRIGPTEAAPPGSIRKQKRSPAAVARGSHRPRAVLTAEQAMQIYLCRPGAASADAELLSVSSPKVALRFGISPKSVRDIWNRRRCLRFFSIEFPVKQEMYLLLHLLLLISNLFVGLLTLLPPRTLPALICGILVCSWVDETQSLWAPGELPSWLQVRRPVHINMHVAKGLECDRRQRRMYMSSIMGMRWARFKFSSHFVLFCALRISHVISDR